MRTGRRISNEGGENLRERLRNVKNERARGRKRRESWRGNYRGGEVTKVHSIPG